MGNVTRAPLSSSCTPSNKANAGRFVKLVPPSCKLLRGGGDIEDDTDVGDDAPASVVGPIALVGGGATAVLRLLASSYKGAAVDGEVVDTFIMVLCVWLLTKKISCSASS